MNAIHLMLLCVVLSLSAMRALGEPPATGPKEGEDTLLDGQIIFVPPAGWQELSRDAKSAQYTSADRKGTIVIAATPQQINLNKSVADQMGMMIKKKVAQDVKAKGGEFLISPRVEEDGLLLLKIHDRFKKGDAVADRMQLYQMVSLNLMTVISIANTASDDEAAAFHKAALDALLSARFQKLDPATGQRVPVKPKRPTTLPRNYWKAKLRILGPTGWKEQMTDNATGTVAAFTDPQHAEVKIVVEVEPLPAGVSEGDPRADSLADEMLSRQEQAAKQAGREAQGETEALDDPAYVRKARRRYAGKPQPTVISARIAQVGNMLVNVVTEAPADQSARVEKLADAWAQESITPIGQKEFRLPEKSERSPTTSATPPPEPPAP